MSTSYVQTFLEWTLTYQDEQHSNTDYYTGFLSRIKTNRSNGGNRVPQGVLSETLDKLLVEKIKTRAELIAMRSSSNSVSERKEIIDTAKESSYGKFLSCMFIHNSDNNKYEQLKKDQHNSYFVGKSI